jgi:hypothetical protein
MLLPVVFVISSLLVSPVGRPKATDKLADGFRNVPNESRMRMIWHVFGPAWTKAEIDRQLDVLKKAGLGGTTFYPIYPVVLDDPDHGVVNLRFGSPAFLDTFAFAARKAKEKGLSFGFNAGTGWPYGGPTVKGNDAAHRLSKKTVPAGTALPGGLKLKEGESVLAANLAGKPVELADVETPTTGPLDVYIVGPTGMQVKRPSFGGEGHVLTHFSAQALERYLAATVDPMLKAAPGLSRTIGCDSFEVYNSNWVQTLPTEFRKRRGYDLREHLPELFERKTTAGKALRFDLWRTLAELTEEQFIKPLGAYAARNGLKLEVQAYGTPATPMTCFRYIDLPMGEHLECKGWTPQKYVASGANQHGKNRVRAEAWTWIGIPDRLGDSLGDLKLASDMTFLEGANDFSGTDFPYSPRSAGSPGWQPYYGPSINENNPQWTFFPKLVEYVNRCQWLLQQGKPVRNVAVYMPVEDVFANGPVDNSDLESASREWFRTGEATSEFGLGKAIKHRSDLLWRLVTSGFDYDFVDFWSLNRLGKCRGGRLEIGNARYSAIVLPNLETMDIEAARKVHAFSEAGGIVMATRRLPDHVAGFGHEAESAELRGLMADMFGVPPTNGVFHSTGGWAVFVSEDRDAGTFLQCVTKPDVAFYPEQTTVGFVHRRAGDADIYFFSNIGPDPVSFQAGFAGAKGRIELWDPLTGGITVPDSSGLLNLTLDPRGSIFAVVGRTTASALPAVRTEQFRTVELASKWHVSFDGPDAPGPCDVDTPASWTGMPGAKYSSGVATYSTSFEWQGEIPARVLVQFDDVREAAEVILNGQTMGVMLNKPWQADVTKGLRAGENKLEVRVANLLVNRFIGQPDQDLAPLRAVYGNRFPDPQEKKVVKEPKPSGLIGGVRLVLERKSQP